MFYSFIQTLVCVLLINGGLHALHLKGNGETTAKAGISASKTINDPVVLLSAGNQFQGFNNPNHEHVQHASSSLKQYETAGRLSDALADLAQLDREHLMSSIDKPAETIAAERHHGRPIITGRVHMSPKNDLVGESDYSSLLLPSLPRGFMFGHVVKHPPADNTDNSAGLTEEYAGNGANPRHVKYEYGRVVQPAQDTEYDSQHVPLDLDSFMELDQEPELDDDFDLDSYQYLDELLAEDQQQREWQELSANHRANNPYQRVEDVQSDTPLALLDLFHKTQENPVEQRKFQTRSGFNPSNVRYQQKWHNKRARQLPLKRNIFAGQQNKQQIYDDDQPQTHYFNQRHNSMLSSIGSEATAYNKNNNNNNNNNQNQNQNVNENTKSEKELNDNLKSAVKAMRNNNNHDASMQRQQSEKQQQQQQQQKQQKTQPSEVRLKEEILVQPNQKRSGGSLIPPGMSTAGSHSIASQLMLRTARGQRQYDVPQIECPTAMDGMERFACPTPDLQGRYRCIDDHVLCDGFIDCPEGEDEDRRSCMFYKTTKAHLDVLADALLRWARGR